MSKYINTKNGTQKFSEHHSATFSQKNLVKSFQCLHRFVIHSNTRHYSSLNEKCLVRLKIGHISKNIELFVLNNNLTHALIGLSYCQTFKLNMKCVKMQIFQNNKRVPQMDSFQNISTRNTLHVSESNNNIQVTVVNWSLSKLLKMKIFGKLNSNKIFSVKMINCWSPIQICLYFL